MRTLACFIPGPGLFSLPPSNPIHHLCKQSCRNSLLSKEQWILFSITADPNRNELLGSQQRNDLLLPMPPNYEIVRSILLNRKRNSELDYWMDRIHANEWTQLRKLLSRQVQTSISSPDGQLFLTITRPDTPILCGRFPSLSFNALWSRGSPFGGVGVTPEVVLENWAELLPCALFSRVRKPCFWSRKTSSSSLLGYGP